MQATTNRRQKWASKLRLEMLEERVPLAGDVAVSIAAGAIVLTGDAQDNDFAIYASSNGRLQIEGRNGTTIGGLALRDMGVWKGDLTIGLLQGGVDNVLLQGALTLHDDLTVELGDGLFTIDGTRAQVKVVDDVSITAGADGHVALLNNVYIGGDVAIDAGGNVNVVAGRARLPKFTATTFRNSLRINNPYLPWVVGAKYTYESQFVDEDTGETVFEDVVVEVLNQTQTIAGVQTRVVRDTVTIDGVLIEDTLDYYAQDDYGNVWYFGEDVTNYEYDGNGNLIGTNTEGSWRAGVSGALPGVIMEAAPTVGHIYYQEFSPQVAVDQAEVLSRTATAAVQAGSYTRVVTTKEMSVLAPEEIGNKFYAPGVGSVQEFGLDYLTGEIIQTTRLVSLELNGQVVAQVVPSSGFFGRNPTFGLAIGVSLQAFSTLTSGDTLIVDGAFFNNHAKLHSDADLAIRDTVFARNLTLTAAEELSIRAVRTIGGASYSGDADVYIVDSTFSSDLLMQFADGDNLLSVARSRITRLVADGGLGNNVYEDLGGNAFRELRLSRFDG